MMRFTGTLGACLAALAVVPATLDPQSSPALGSIEGALSKTVRALELLSGIRTTEEPVTMTLVREVTEEPLPADPERDQKLDLLRTQVSLLQQELDLVEQRQQGRANGQPVAPELVEAVAPADALAQPNGITKGLDASLLAELKDFGVRPAARARPPSEPPANPAYSADPLLHAQACYRAGQYERGEGLLADDDGTAALYWRARCLEKLERLDEARALYTTVMGRADAGSLADRARTNLEFIEWKAQFMAKLPSELQDRKEPR